MNTYKVTATFTVEAETEAKARRKALGTEAILADSVVVTKQLPPKGSWENPWTDGDDLKQAKSGDFARGFQSGGMWVRINDLHSVKGGASYSWHDVWRRVG